MAGAEPLPYLPEDYTPLYEAVKRRDYYASEPLGVARPACLSNGLGAPSEYSGGGVNSLLCPPIPASNSNSRHVCVPAQPTGCRPARNPGSGEMPKFQLRPKRLVSSTRILAGTATQTPRPHASLCPTWDLSSSDQGHTPPPKPGNPCCPRAPPSLTQKIKV